jgi:hypothetical protein
MGWVLCDERGRPALLEAWPEGRAGLLAPPARTPGGAGDEDDPLGVKGGAATPRYLRRLLDRLEEMFEEDTPRMRSLRRLLDALGVPETE